MYRNIENRFNVIYPENENATYESILNYSTEGNNPFQRWYRYKEGFSIQFIEKIVEEYKSENISVLLDPFAGSGTTVLAANKMGYKGIGFEVNPFSYFLMKNKVQKYDNADILAFWDSSQVILDELSQDKLELYELPKLSISGKVFQPEAERYMMSCKEKIRRVENTKAHDLLFLGWLACIEELSD